MKPKIALFITLITLILASTVVQANEPAYQNARQPQTGRRYRNSDAPSRRPRRFRGRHGKRRNQLGQGLRPG